MYRSLVYLPLALLFIAIGPSQAQTGAAEPASAPSAATEPAPADDGTKSIVELAEPFENVIYEVKHPIALHCTLPNDKGLPYVWSKNGTNVNELGDLKDRFELAERGALWKTKGRTTEDDFGNYTCALQGAPGLQAWRVRARPHLKLDENVNVVEKQTLKIQCKVIGKPYPSVRWTYNGSRTEGDASNGTDVLEALGARARLARSEQGVEGALLVVESAERTDAGFYTCHAAPRGLPPANATTQLRVKDMYAALWPFLGICAEVVVLCAIILVYEKRRTKPELDDSDTDNHDQKKS